MSIINNGVAGKAELNPKDDPIYLENPDSEGAKPYIIIISKEAVKAIEQDSNDGEIVKDLSDKEIKKIEDSLK